MSRAFSLAGLLRLRHLQQDQAAGDLSEANSQLRAAVARTEETRAALEHLPSTPSGAHTLAAIAAARASSRSMLTELAALDAVARQATGDAQREFDARKAASVSLEKLQTRHRLAQDAADLHAEQAVIDEIASTGWHRRTGDTAAGARTGDTP